MSDPFTSGDKVIKAWEEGVSALRDLEYAAAEAEVAHKVARAEAFDRSSGSVAARDRHAEKATAEQLRARLKAAADVRVHNEYLRFLREKLGYHRTEAATDRALSGVGT